MCNTTMPRRYAFLGYALFLSLTSYKACPNNKRLGSKCHGSDEMRRECHWTRRWIICSSSPYSNEYLLPLIDAVIQYQILLLGGLSGRLDQTIHTLSFLYKQRISRPRIMAITDDSLAWILDTVCAVSVSIAYPSRTHLSQGKAQDRCWFDNFGPNLWVASRRSRLCCAKYQRIGMESMWVTCWVFSTKSHRLLQPMKCRLSVGCCRPQIML